MRIGIGALLVAALLAGCKSTPDPPAPANVTLINLHDEVASGAVLEFDRRIQHAELESDSGFASVRVGQPTPNSVTLTGGRLREGEVASYVVTGAEGAPNFVGGHWFHSGQEGPPLRRNETRIRFPKEWPGGDPREKLG
jgi:hypothetical protein